MTVGSRNHAIYSEIANALAGGEIRHFRPSDKSRFARSVGKPAGAANKFSGALESDAERVRRVRRDIGLAVPNQSIAIGSRECVGGCGKTT